MADRTSISANSTSDFEEQQVYQIGHDMALGGDGLRLAARLTYAITRPGLDASIPPVNAHTLFANVEATYPLIRQQALTLRGAVGMDFVNQRILFAGAPLSRDRIRVAYLRFDADAIDLKGVGPGGSIGWRANGTIELRKGLGILGASPNCLATPAVCADPAFVPPSLTQGNPQATVLRGSANAEANVLRGLTLALAPRFQVSSAPLFGFEQMALGNFTVGRGFDPGAETGDAGVAVTVEARFRPFRLRQNDRLEIQPYVFSDNGWVWRRLSPTPNPQSLHSLGAGLRMVWASKVRFDLSGAVPLSTLPGEAGRRDARILGTLAINLLPWRPR